MKNPDATIARLRASADAAASVLAPGHSDGPLVELARRVTAERDAYRVALQHATFALETLVMLGSPPLSPAAVQELQQYATLGRRTLNDYAPKN